MMEHIKKISPWMEVAMLVWFGIVYLSYIYFHKSIDIFVFILFLFFLFYIFYKFIISKQFAKLEWRVTMPLWKIALTLFVLTIIISYSFNVIYTFQTSGFHFLNILLDWVTIFYTLFLRAVFIGALVLLSASFGKTILEAFQCNNDDRTEEFIFSFGAGFLVIVFILFLFGIFSFLDFGYIAMIIGVLAILSLKNIKYFFNIFVSQKIEFHLSNNFLDKKNIISWGMAFIIVLALITFIQTMYLVPAEYDDLDTYYSVPVLFSHYHKIVPFYNAINPIAGGIIMPFYAAVNVLLSPSFNFSISWLFLWLLLFLLYFFTKKFFSENTAFLTLFLAATVPMNINFISSQKIDFILVFFSILSIYSLFHWLNSKANKWLYLSAIFLGFAVNIKMNGFFLVLTGFIILGLLFIGRKISFKSGFIYFVLTIITLSPIVLYNIYYYKNPTAPFPLSQLSNPIKNIFLTKEKVTLYDIFAKTDYLKQHSDEITNLTRQNQVNGSRIINFFWLFWNIIINQKGFNFIYSEAGPFLLIFLPFFLLSFVIKKYYKEKNIIFLLSISFIYLIIWYFKGYERVWYALPIFYLLFIPCVIFLQEVQKGRIIIVMYFFIIIFALRTLFLPINYINSESHVINSAYASSDNQQQNQRNQSLFTLYDYINKNIIDTYKNPLILMMPDSRVGTIQEWDKNVIADHWGMYWIYLLEEKYSMPEIKEIFVKQGITHIFFSNSFYSWIKSFADKDNKKYAIIKNLEMFDSFKNTYLTKSYCVGENDCIYEIKK